MALPAWVVPTAVSLVGASVISKKYASESEQLALELAAQARELQLDLFHRGQQFSKSLSLRRADRSLRLNKINQQRERIRREVNAEILAYERAAPNYAQAENKRIRRRALKEARRNEGS